MARPLLSTKEQADLITDEFKLLQKRLMDLRANLSNVKFHMQTTRLIELFDEELDEVHPYTI